MAELWRYFLTRLLQWRMVLLYSALFATLLLSDAAAAPAVLWPQAVFLLAAIAVFRLWDDLADVEYDRSRHPDRVLVQSRDRRPYIALVTAGLALLALALRGDTRDLLAYLGLVALLVVLYHSGAGRRLPRPARSGLVLIKYPLFVYLLATPSLRAWLAALALYLLLLAFEWRDDAALRNTAARPLLFAAVAAGAALSALYWSAGVLP